MKLPVPPCRTLLARGAGWVWLVSCGARSALDPALDPALPVRDAAADISSPRVHDASRPPGADASPPPHDASPPLPDASPPPGVDAGMRPSTCTSALLAGAPAPLVGYCSTRARLAPVAGPISPSVAWSVPLTGLTSVPYDLVVDASGRAYVAYGTSRGTGEPDTVEAVDADGTVAWVHGFAGQDPQHLFLATDGHLRLVLSFPSPTLVVMGSAGEVLQSSPVPGNADLLGLAVGRDGSLYAAADVGGKVEKMTSMGALVWTSTVDICSGVVVLTADDHVVGTSCDPGNATVVELDGGGSVAWQTKLGTLYPLTDPAVALDGSIRVMLSESATTSAVPPHLMSLDAAGNILWTTKLPDTGVGVTPDEPAIAADGTTIVRTSASIVAVSASGTILWQLADTSGYTSDFAIDAKGMLIVADTELRGLDRKSGKTLWTLEGGMVPFVLGLGGSIVGIRPADDGFSLYLARDP